MFYKIPRRITGLAVAVATCLTWSATQAAVKTWDGGSAANANWNTATNWNTDGVPANNDEADFGALGSPQANPTITVYAQIGEIIFLSGAAGHNIASSAGITLRINAISGMGVVNNSSTTQQISVGTIRAQNAQTWNAASGALNFTGNSINLNGNTLTIDGGYNTSIANLISNGNLTKNGNGRLTLSAANTYTGGTTINGGLLTLGVANAILTNRAVTVAGGGYDLNGFTTVTNGAISISSGAISNGKLVGASYASTDGGTISAILAGSGGLTKAGAGTLTLTGSNTYTGVTTINGGVLVLSNAFALPGGIGTTGGTSALTFNGGVIGLGNGNFYRSLGATGTVTAANFTGAGGWAAYGADRVVNLGGATGTINWATANTGFNGRTLILGASTATHTVDLQNPLNLSNAVRIVQVDDGAAAIDGKLSGVLSGAGGGLTKTGAGTLMLSATNTYSGVTTVSNGVLVLNNAFALPGGIGSSGGSNNLTISGGMIGLGNNDFQRGLGTGSNQVQFTSSGGFAAYTADRNVNLGGASAQVTWASNSFVPTGSVLILGASSADKTVTFQNPIALNGAARTVQVDNGSASVDAILSGILSGTGSSGLTKTGAGTLALTAANSYTGGTTINTGTLQIGNGGTSGSVVGSITNNAALVFNKSGSYTTTNALVGAGTTKVTGGGTNSLTGALSGYTGNTTVTNATAYFNHSGTYAGLITADTGGTVGGTGTVGSLLVRGVYSPGNSPGTQTVANLTITNLGTLKMDLVQTNNHDLVVVTNSFALAPTSYLQLAITNAVPFAYGSQFALVDNTYAGLQVDGTNQYFTLKDYLSDGITASGFNGLVLTNGVTFSAVGGGTVTNVFQINYDALANGGTGFDNDVVLTVIPEPGTLALALLCGLPPFLLLFLRRRARARAEA